MPRVSIVTPSYNHARYLSRRVSSILRQTHCDFEWIIVDDCSTDGSFDLLRSLIGTDRRVTLLKNERNYGMAMTVQKAIALAKGDLIYRAESDDFCEPRFLERMVQVFDRYPNVGLAFCRSLSVDTNDKIWGGKNQPSADYVRNGIEFFQSLVLGNFIPGCNILFSREAHDRVGGFGTGPFRISCDWRFSLAVCFYYDIAYVAEALGYHRIHESNLGSRVLRTYDVDELFRETYEVILDVFRSSPEHLAYLKALQAAAIRQKTRRYIAPLYLQALLSGRVSIAKKMRQGVNRYDPDYAGTPGWVWAAVSGLLFRLLYRRIYSPLYRGYNSRRGLRCDQPQ